MKSTFILTLTDVEPVEPRDLSLPRIGYQIKIYEPDAPVNGRVLEQGSLPLVDVAQLFQNRIVKWQGANSEFSRRNPDTLKYWSQADKAKYISGYQDGGMPE